MLPGGQRSESNERDGRVRSQGTGAVSATDGAGELHRSSIVIDGTCPLLRRREFVDWYIAGGATACAPTVGGPTGALETLRNLAGWHGMLRQRPDLISIRQAADIDTAKRDARLGLVFHFQGADPIENDLDLVEAYAALGVRMVQLTYNVRNRVGDGCEEASDAGLSRFGRDLIRRLEEARLVVDGSHTGYRTTMEAIELSTRPFVFSHANAKRLKDSPRNLTDEQIKAAAATGGLIGIVGFPAFVGDSARPTLADFVRHIDYVAELVGIDHVALGIDYYEGQHPVADPAEAERLYRGALAAGKWSVASYPPPPYHYPDGIPTPRELPNLTRFLLGRGYHEDDVRKILGGNWLRVFRAVWGG
jgi:membrane dipeptidase